jgi:hypothetical protein
MFFSSHSMKSLCFPLIMTALAMGGLAMGQSGPKVDVSFSSSGAHRATPAPIPQVNFNALVQRVVSKMPNGGNYSTGREAFDRLCTKVFAWQPNYHRLAVYPREARPSFCSEACYLVFVQSLQLWCQQVRRNFSDNFWISLLVYPGQKDGMGAWGRMNSNGPGMAKWVHDLRAGVNFTDPSKAAPGDFMKIFWTDQIGAREFGHFVIFQGLGNSAQGPTITFWSSNMDGGYGKKTILLSQVRRMIFTRITHPENFANAIRLPETDEWLASLLSVSVTPRDVVKKCGIVSPSPSFLK